jgi:hypothetical protein
VITAVDTNVLIDIFIDDRNFGKASATALRNCLKEGAVTACGIVLAEFALLFPSPADCLKAFSALGIRVDTISQDSFLNTAKYWKIYKQAGGKKERVVADFIIGGYAITQCNRLLTRDRGFFRKYFQQLKVVY